MDLDLDAAGLGQARSASYRASRANWLLELSPDAQAG